MRQIGFLFVICSLLGFAAWPTRADGFAFFRARGATHSITGTVKSLGADTMTISMENKKGTKSKDHEIKVIPQTVVFVNGKLGALTDVAVGENVKVTMDHGHASQIAITTATTAPAQS